jgi:predicted ATP-grasp superfamily ATP-dependent carboligase
MKIKKILITNGDYLSAVGISRYLGKKDLDIYAVGNHNKAIVSFSKYCKKYYSVPFSDDDSYLSSIKNIITNHSIDLIIPVGFQNTLFFAKNKEYFSTITHIEIAGLSSVEIALNKQKTYSLAEELGIPYPQTLYPEDMDKLLEMGDRIGYPLVIKGLFEAGSNIVAFVDNRNELNNKYLKLCKENNISNNSLPMLQKYVTGNDTNFFGFNVLYQYGNCKRIFIQRRVRKATNIGTASCADTSIPDWITTEIKNSGLKIMDNLHWHGVACLEFKLDDTDKKIKLIEINPKFWTSTEMSLVAGVNFPYYLCQIAEGKELEYSEEYNNLKFHFSLSSDLKQTLFNPRSIPSYIKDCINPRVKSNLDWCDIIPNFIELKNSLTSIIYFYIRKLFRYK